VQQAHGESSEVEAALLSRTVVVNNPDFRSITIYGYSKAIVGAGCSATGITLLIALPGFTLVAKVV